MNTTSPAAASIGRVTTRLASPITARIIREAKGMPAICWISTLRLPRHGQRQNAGDIKRIMQHHRIGLAHRAPQRHHAARAGNGHGQAGQRLGGVAGGEGQAGHIGGGGILRAGGPYNLRPLRDHSAGEVACHPLYAAKMAFEKWLTIRMRMSPLLHDRPAAQQEIAAIIAQEASGAAYPWAARRGRAGSMSGPLPAGVGAHGQGIAAIAAPAHRLPKGEAAVQQIARHRHHQKRQRKAQRRNPSAERRPRAAQSVPIITALCSPRQVAATKP
jgi:hypothetical protein